MSADTAPPMTGVHHFSPTVSDVEASAGWYQKVFGMTRLPVTLARHDREETGYAMLLVEPNSGVVIALHHHAHGTRDGFDEGRTGLDHIGFGVPTRESLDHRRLGPAPG